MHAYHYKCFCMIDVFDNTENTFSFISTFQRILSFLFLSIFSTMHFKVWSEIFETPSIGARRQRGKCGISRASGTMKINRKKYIYIYIGICRSRELRIWVKLVENRHSLIRALPTCTRIRFFPARNSLDCPKCSAKRSRIRGVLSRCDRD